MSDDLQKFKASVKTMMAETMPTDETGLKAKWQLVGDENGVDVKAEDSFNPFWRMLSALTSTPVLWLIDFMSEKVMPNQYLKYASGDALQDIAWGMDVEKKTEKKCQVMITFTRVEIDGTLDVPVDTWIHSPEINGVIYKLRTLALAQFAIGELEIDILCEAEQAGEAYNLGTGYYHVLPKEVSGVIAVTNKDSSIVSPGQDEESDEDLRARTRDKWSTQYSWHADVVYRSIVSEFDGVDSDAIWFDRATPRSENSADILLLFEAGEPSQTFLDSINEEIKSNELTGLGDDVLVKGISRIGQDIVCNYSSVPGLTDDQETTLKTDLMNFIGAAFRENTGSGWSVTKTQPYDDFSFGLLTHEMFSAFSGKIKNLRFENDDVVSELWVPSIQTLAVNKI